MGKESDTTKRLNRNKYPRDFLNVKMQIICICNQYISFFGEGGHAKKMLCLKLSLRSRKQILRIVKSTEMADLEVAKGWEEGATRRFC